MKALIVVLFIMLYEVDHLKETVELYFHVVLFIMLYKVVLIFNSADKTLVSDFSNES